MTMKMMNKIQYLMVGGVVLLAVGCKAPALTAEEQVNFRNHLLLERTRTR